VLTASSDGSISSEASGCSILSPKKSGASSRVAHGCYVTTITRGWSAEADKLLDYLVRLFDYSGVIHSLTFLVLKENGIFDAIEKQYLRSFIFAIYLVRISETL
jgi:meiosis-specific protein